MLPIKLRNPLWIALIVFSLSLASRAQQPAKQEPTPSTKPTEVDQQISPDDVVRISTRLVQFDAVVTDRRGRVVTNLRPEDFLVTVNDKPQTITNFSYIVLAPEGSSAPLPFVAKKGMPPPPGMRVSQIGRNFTLMLDDFCMPLDSVYRGRKLLHKFVDEQMQPHDVAAIVSTFNGVGTLQQFTADRRQLHAAIDKLRYRRCPQAGWEQPSYAGSLPQSGPVSESTSNDLGLIEATGGNDITDSYATRPLLSALDYVTRGIRDLPGRKAIVILSGGLKVSNPYPLLRITERANRASAVIYTIHMGGVDPLWFTAAEPGPQTTRSSRNLSAQTGMLASRRGSSFDAQTGLRLLTRLTGGFAVDNTNDFAGGMNRASDDQRGYYLIGYRPDETTFDPEKGPKQFNSLKVKLRGHDDVSVRFRNGFLGIPDKRSAPENLTRAEHLIAALRSPVGTDGVGLRLTSLFTNEAGAGTVMRSLLHVNPRDLSFKQDKDGSWESNIDVVAVTMGVDGSIADQITKNQTIRVQDDKYQHFLQDGLVYALDLPLKKPGAYELRIAILDRASAKLGSAREFVQVPDLEKRNLALSGVVVSGRQPDKNSGSAAANQEATLATAYGPAVRRFRRGMMLDYGFVIYNTKMMSGTLPQLTVETHLYQDGREILNGKPQPIMTQPQRDLNRIIAGGSLRLDDKLPPGWYSLEVVVVDALAKKPMNTASQWVDFEIVD